MSRPRGFIDDYAPRRKTRELLDQIGRVLETYEAELPLTARQVFYRLVATVDYPKTENGYGRLQEHLSIPGVPGLCSSTTFAMTASSSSARSRSLRPSTSCVSPKTSPVAVKGCALEGQPQWIEVWCEAAGMVPQLARAVGEYGVTVY